MNPENPTPREQLEARVTALLLGELPAAEAASLRAEISRDAALAALHRRLEQTIGLVRETAADPVEQTAEQPAPLRLSEERRQKLLAQFKTVTPKEFVRPKRDYREWLVPAAATAALVLIIGVMAVPNFVRSRVTSQANAIANNLRQIDGAKELWAIENKMTADATPTMSDLLPYLGKGNGEMPPPVIGEKYIIGSLAEAPSIEVDAKQARNWGDHEMLSKKIAAPPGRERFDLGDLAEIAGGQKTHTFTQTETVATAAAEAATAKVMDRMVGDFTTTNRVPGFGSNKVYAANVVGYVNLNVTSNNFTLMENPLTIDGARSQIAAITPGVAIAGAATPPPVPPAHDNIVLPSITELAAADKDSKKADGTPPSDFMFYMDLNRTQGEKSGGFVTGTTRDDVSGSGALTKNNWVNGGVALADSGNMVKPGENLKGLQNEATINDSQLTRSLNGMSNDFGFRQGQPNAEVNYDYWHWGVDSNRGGAVSTTQSGYVDTSIHWDPSTANANLPGQGFANDAVLLRIDKSLITTNSLNPGTGTANVPGFGFNGGNIALDSTNRYIARYAYMVPGALGTDAMELADSRQRSVNKNDVGAPKYLGEGYRGRVADASGQIFQSANNWAVNSTQLGFYDNFALADSDKSSSGGQPANARQAQAAAVGGAGGGTMVAGWAPGAVVNNGNLALAGGKAVVIENFDATTADVRQAQAEAKPAWKLRATGNVGLADGSVQQASTAGLNGNSTLRSGDYLFIPGGEMPDPRVAGGDNTTIAEGLITKRKAELSLDGGTRSSNESKAAADKPMVYDGRLGVLTAGETAREAGAPANNQLETRTFKVDPNTFIKGLEGVTGTPFGGGGGGGGGGFGGGAGGRGGAGGASGGAGGGLEYVTAVGATTQIQSAARQYFAASGLDLSTNDGKAVVFNDRNGTLTVRATPQEFDGISATIDAINSIPAEANKGADWTGTLQRQSTHIQFSPRAGDRGQPGSETPVVLLGNIAIAAAATPTVATASAPANGESGTVRFAAGTYQAASAADQPRTPAGQPLFVFDATSGAVDQPSNIPQLGDVPLVATLFRATTLAPVETPTPSEAKLDARHAPATMPGLVAGTRPTSQVVLPGNEGLVAHNTTGQMDNEVAVLDNVRREAGIMTQANAPGQLIVTNGMVQLAQNDQGALRDSVKREASTISLKNSEPQDAQQIVKQLFPDSKATNGTTSVQSNPLLQRSMTVQQNFTATNRFDTVSSTRDYPNRTTNGPVSVSIDPTTGGLIVITDDKTFGNAYNVIASADRKQAADANTRREDRFGVTEPEVLAFTNRGVLAGDKIELRLQLGRQPTLSNRTNTVYAQQATATSTSALNKKSGKSEITNAVIVSTNYQVAAQVVQLEDRPEPRVAAPPLIPQPEVLVRENAFSTFSLNVSDVAFKLAGVSLDKGLMPDPGTVRSEEFINAFDYRDPEPPPGAPVGFTWERARYPFAHNRDLLRFAIKTAAAGRQPGRPLNIVLLLDNSGSMERADRVAIIREALRVLAAQLQPQDRLSVVTFARTARLWVDGIAGGEAGAALEKAGELTPEGGTNLEEAMRLAYETALRHYLANGMNRVVLLTDGAANLGNVDPAMLKREVELHRKQGVALDCFGIGWEGYNDDLLETLSRNGDGRYGFINTPEEAATGFAGQLAGAFNVAASDVKVQVEFNPKRATAYRQIGYAKHQLTKEQFRDNTVNAAQIAAAESGNALYTVEVNPQGEGPVCTVRVRYRTAGTQDYREQAWDVPYEGGSAAMESVSPAMRLAATAGAFSEWLGASPFAAEVEPDRLLALLNGVPEVYGADARPKKLEAMIRQAKSISGK